MIHTVLWAIILLFVVLWLIGLFFRVGQCFIHILLVFAGMLLLVNVLSLIYHAF